MFPSFQFGAVAVATRTTLAGASATDSMDKVRKLLSSPASRRKASNNISTNNSNVANGNTTTGEAVAGATSNHVTLTSGSNGVSGHLSVPLQGAPSRGPGPGGMTGPQPYGGGYFGVSLEELGQREGRDIPHLITRVCAYIYDTGKYWGSIKYNHTGTLHFIANVYLSCNFTCIVHDIASLYAYSCQRVKNES